MDLPHGESLQESSLPAHRPEGAPSAERGCILADLTMPDKYQIRILDIPNRHVNGDEILFVEPEIVHDQV
jgi:hypothetical protein